MLTDQAAGADREAEVDAAMLEVAARYDRATDGTCAVQGDYVEVIVVRS